MDKLSNQDDTWEIREKQFDGPYGGVNWMALRFNIYIYIYCLNVLPDVNDCSDTCMVVDY